MYAHMSLYTGCHTASTSWWSSRNLISYNPAGFEEAAVPLRSSLLIVLVNGIFSVGVRGFHMLWLMSQTFWLAKLSEPLSLIAKSNQLLPVELQKLCWLDFFWGKMILTVWGMDLRYGFSCWLGVGTERYGCCRFVVWPSAVVHDGR